MPFDKKQSRIRAMAAAAILLMATGSFGQATSLPKPPICADKPPYDAVPYAAVNFVPVAPHVQLEVLDWGGSGETMVLLTGAGDNAHVYDYFAYQFTNYFHVVGITRRGWLPSSQPPRGYDVPTRASDDIKVLDALGISKAVFVGHSVAGAELSELGSKYANRVDKLVYLDATDLAERNTFPDVPGAFGLFTDADGASIFGLQAAYARLLAVREPIPAICLSFQFDQGGKVLGTTTSEAIQAALLAGVSLPAKQPTNWEDVKVPRLGIFAPPTAESKLPWYPYLTASDQAVFDERFPRLVQWFTDEIDRFSKPQSGSPTPVVYLLPGAPHYIYINNEVEVVREMRKFLGID
jgi:pimeloyl-ACP methyl ester carboxylesterase